MAEPKIHTVFISYERVDLTRRALDSYLETVTAPWSACIVDNGSGAETIEWLERVAAAGVVSAITLGRNRYPGYACNKGFGEAPADATFLHRADNDFTFLPGWWENVHERFADGSVGQVGLRTDEEEEWAVSNVGGNMVLRRSLWDAGLRYDERPWPQYPPGFSEDSYLSPAVRKMGYDWARVGKPSIVSTANVDLDDPYYQKSLGDRRILEWARERHANLLHSDEAS